MQNRALIYIVCVVACASLLLLVIAEQGMVEPTPIPTERLLVGWETRATGNADRPSSNNQSPTSLLSGKLNTRRSNDVHQMDAKHQRFAESSSADKLHTRQPAKLFKTDGISRSEDGWSTWNDQSFKPSESTDYSPDSGDRGSSFLVLKRFIGTTEAGALRVGLGSHPTFSNSTRSDNQSI